MEMELRGTKWEQEDSWEAVEEVGWEMIET